MRKLLSLEFILPMVAIAASSVTYAQTVPPATPPAEVQQPPSLSPAMPVIDPAKMAAPAGAKPVSAPVEPDTFVLGAEDQITVSMWDEPKFNGAYTIRPDGKIMVGLIGEIQAAGLTPLELQESINKAASSLIRTPRSTVNVTAVHSKHVYFDGEGIAAGAIDLGVPLHLLEAISARGGFKDFADSKHIRILRDGKLYMTINYSDLTSGKHPEKNILLLDKDHVFVK